MAKLNNQDLMSEFFSEVRNDYPDLTYEQLKETCFGPWRFLKEQMESGKFPTVRMMYFGKFTVTRGRAKWSIKDIDKKVKDGLMSEDRRDRYKKLLEEFLENFDK